MVFQFVLTFLLSRLRRTLTIDSLGSSDPENAGGSDTDTEVRLAEFGYATEPDGERAPTSDDTIDEIAREVDERSRGQHADDAEFEFSGEEADLGDVTPPRLWRQRRLSLSHRFPTFTSLTTTPTWWHRFKHLVFPPNPDFDELVPHYRMTPVISGIIVPFSLLLEIPGLTEHWYIRTEGNNIVETRPNSVILEVGLAVSIFSGLVANIFLVMRFLEIRVKTMTILSVAFLSIHGESRSGILSLDSILIMNRRCHQHHRRHRFRNRTSL
jgi:potassium channel subfamily K